MWGQIIGAVAGSLLGNKSAEADRAATERMNAQNNQYLNAAMPYIKSNMSDVSDMYKDMIARGPYQGEFYAGPNDMQTTANTALYNMGTANMGTGQNLMDQAGGFANNANSLFGQYSGMVNRPDMMSQATDYAMDNMNPIVDAMMRDSTRQLTEQTLPGINMAASGSGNMNSSRAGVADALANRAYDDRRADVRSEVFNSLRDASLNQSNNEFNQSLNALSGASSANNTLGNAFTTGARLASSGGNMALGAGNMQNTWDQGQLDADRERFDYLNNYNYNLGKDYQGFLTGNNITGNYAVNAANPGAATIGGAMSGFGFGNNYLSGRPGGFGNQPIFDGIFGGPGLDLSFQ